MKEVYFIVQLPRRVDEYIGGGGGQGECTRCRGAMLKVLECVCGGAMLLDISRRIKGGVTEWWVCEKGVYGTGMHNGQWGAWVHMRGVGGNTVGRARSPTFLYSVI